MSEKTSLKGLTSSATLSEIVVANPEAGELLASIGLKPANHKNQSLRRVCQQRKWSETEVLQWIKRKCRPANGVQSECRWEDSLTGRCDYLKEKFHQSNKKRLAEIDKDFPRVRQIHGNQYPWLKHIQGQFERFEEALELYYQFEEKKFYRLLAKLENADDTLLYGSIKKMKRSIDIIHKDQSRIKEYMKKLRVDSNEFENPPGACSTFRILNQNMKLLFEAVGKQFELEEQKLLPAVQKKIETVYL